MRFTKTGDSIDGGYTYERKQNDTDFKWPQRKKPAIPNALRAIVMDKSSRFSKNCPDNWRAAFGIANARLQKNDNSTPTFGIAARVLTCTDRFSES